jgi:hypothetical protein
LGGWGGVSYVNQGGRFVTCRIFLYFPFLFVNGIPKCTRDGRMLFGLGLLGVFRLFCVADIYYNMLFFSVIMIGSFNGTTVVTDGLEQYVIIFAIRLNRIQISNVIVPITPNVIHVMMAVML